MEGKKLDKWAQWMLHTRFAGSAADNEAMMRRLREVRDRVLSNAGLHEGTTLLDVGAGDGLIAFGALDMVGESGTVILSDISLDLLDAARRYAEEAGVTNRCRFVASRAESLSPVESDSVDAVTTRSVLIYVNDKQAAFREFYRVLKPGGRISLYEPINAFAKRNYRSGHWGIDVGPVEDLEMRVRAVYDAIHPPDSDPLLAFDERDLFSMAQEAGFMPVNLAYEARVTPSAPGNWEDNLHSAPTPLVPTLQEAINQALNEEEAQRYTAYIKPIVERGGSPEYRAGAYLWAVKPPEVG